MLCDAKYIHNLQRVESGRKISRSFGEDAILGHEANQVRMARGHAGGVPYQVPARELLLTDHQDLQAESAKCPELLRGNALNSDQIPGS